MTSRPKTLKGAVPFHFKVPICDLRENGKIYGIDFQDGRLEATK
jgi:hypothetical protein